jgi:hypothetical protein
VPPRIPYDGAVSPEPWVRYQAGALCAALIGTAVIGGGIFALSLAALVAFFAFILWLKYTRDMDRAERTAPPHRDRLDVLVAGDARASLLPALVLACFVIIFRPTPPTVAPYVLDAVATVAVVVAAIYVSSLFDWYLILPRLSGLLGVRPCKPEGEPPGWPNTWRKVTRWWYIHRIVAAFFLVYGLALALGLVASGLTSASSNWVEFAFAAVLGTFGAYQKAILPAVKEAGHPHLIVGRTYASAFSPRRYVFDVSIEGVGLVPTAKYEEKATEPLPADGIEYEKHPDEINHTQARELAGAEPYIGCERRCAGISWYCIENERCFEEK